MKNLHLTAALVMSLLGAGAANATVLVTDTDTIGATSSTGFFGESVTTPVGGPISAITFNFYGPGLASVSSGTLYVFSSIYAGTPNNLVTAGALASSVTNSGVYAFNPSFTLAGGTKYYFYEARNTTVIGEATGSYAGGDAFYSNDKDTGFVELPTADYDFTLSGTQAHVHVPEPLSLSLFGAGLAGAVWLRRRKVKKA